MNQFCACGRQITVIIRVRRMAASTRKGRRRRPNHAAPTDLCRLCFCAAVDRARIAAAAPAAVA